MPVTQGHCCGSSVPDRGRSSTGERGFLGSVGCAVGMLLGSSLLLRIAECASWCREVLAVTHACFIVVINVIDSIKNAPSIQHMNVRRKKCDAWIESA